MNPDIRSKVRSYADDRKNQASAWKKLAEAAAARARLCEDAGREAHDLTRITDDYTQVLEQELEKIEARYLLKVTKAAPLVLVEDDAVDLKSLRDWFNNHTNYSGPGPTSPLPAVPTGEAVWRAR